MRKTDTGSFLCCLQASDFAEVCPYVLQPWMPLLPDGTNFDVQVLVSLLHCSALYLNSVSKGYLKPPKLQMQHGSAETEVGAVRQAKFGGGSQIFEKLVALDDDQHIMKWQLVSHSNTVNPFQEASFVNFFTTLSLQPVTIGDCTFAEWEGMYTASAICVNCLLAHLKAPLKMQRMQANSTRIPCMQTPCETRLRAGTLVA